jgi:hypothetical protein
MGKAILSYGFVFYLVHGIILDQNPMDHSASGLVYSITPYPTATVLSIHTCPSVEDKIC